MTRSCNAALMLLCGSFWLPSFLLHCAEYDLPFQHVLCTLRTCFSACPQETAEFRIRAQELFSRVSAGDFFQMHTDASCRTFIHGSILECFPKGIKPWVQSAGGIIYLRKAFFIANAHMSVCAVSTQTFLIARRKKKTDKHNALRYAIKCFFTFWNSMTHCRIAQSI